MLERGRRENVGKEKRKNRKNTIRKRKQNRRRLRGSKRSSYKLELGKERMIPVNALKPDKKHNQLGQGQQYE